MVERAPTQKLAPPTHPPPQTNWFPSPAEFLFKDLSRRREKRVCKRLSCEKFISENHLSRRNTPSFFLKMTCPGEEGPKVTELRKNSIFVCPPCTRSDSQSASPLLKTWRRRC